MTEELAQKTELRIIEPPTVGELVVAAQPNLKLGYMHRESDWKKPFEGVKRLLLEGEARPIDVLFACILVLPLIMIFILGKYLFMFAALTLIVVGMFFVLDVRMNKTSLLIRPDGLRLPLRFLVCSRFKLSRRWSDLKLLIFDRDGQPSTDPNRIILRFNDNAYADFDIYGFSREDLKKLFLCLAINAPELPKYPPIEDLKPQLYQVDSRENPLSFTNLWEADLNARFASTAFLPLDSGATLQDGRLKVIGQIGVGGFSAVYLAQTEEGTAVALKEAVVPASANEKVKAKAIEMFGREAQILCTLDHPGVAKVFDYFVENDRHYLLLEYVHGTNLRNFVRQFGAQPEKVVLGWIKQVAKILLYLHSLDPPVLHRDITPENLMLTRDGNLVLIDFGAANNFVSSATGTFVGKQAYISPEQFRGKAVPASDIYSLAATAYFLLTGNDPEPLSPLRIGDELPKLSSGIKNLLEECTQLDAQRRIGTAKELLQTISKLAQQPDLQ
jgi:hypothetical protein